MQRSATLLIATGKFLRAVRRARSVLLGSLLILVGLPVEAALNTRDLQVLARTLGFLDPPRSGAVTVGIAFDPASTSSTLEANATRDLLRDGLRVGNLELQGVLVPIPEAAQANVDIFLLASGSGSRAADLVPVLRQRKLPCITDDLEQVRAGHCIVGIQSAPRVEIVVNSSLASECEMEFASVFRMMIKEF